MTLATRVRGRPFRRAQFRILALGKVTCRARPVVVAIMRGDKPALLLRSRNIETGACDTRFMRCPV